LEPTVLAVDVLIVAMLQDRYRLLLVIAMEPVNVKQVFMANHVQRKTAQCLASIMAIVAIQEFVYVHILTLDHHAILKNVIPLA